MKTLTLIALALSACGPMVGASDTVRCAHVDGGFSTVLCSCASSCALQPDLSIRAEVIDGCGESACWQEPQERRELDAGTPAASNTAALLQ